jgi:acyl-CoA reductase-like NAD-dependent aldehyde dehydrogenase
MTQPTAARDRIVSRDPRTGEVVGELPVTSPREVRLAVGRAREVQPAWAETPFEERAAALERARPLLEAAAEELASLARREMGKPTREGMSEAGRAVSRIDYYVAASRKAVAPAVYREGEVETTVRHDPLGVVAAITPWNFPLGVPTTLIYPALLTGNAVLHKPSEKTPLTGQRLTGILASVLPPGVLQHLPGDDRTGRALVESELEMVAFVGSQAAGRDIMSRASRDLKRIVLELGGKDPMVVLADADLDRAAEHAVSAGFRNAGQVCCAVERIFVERGAADAFLERLVARAREAELGPLADPAQREHVERLVDDAVSRGARVLAGGHAAAADGCRYPATVLVGVDGSMEIGRVETFGPVLCVRVVEDEEEALRGANETDFGLGATVWSGDPERAERIAARLQAGMVGINRDIHAVGDAPWVGARQSGYGFLRSTEGIRHFTQARTITRTCRG